MRRFFKGVAVVLTVLVIIFAGFFVFITRGLDEKSQPALSGATAQGLMDGAYEGSYDGGRWTNRVKVTVAGEKITDIVILQDVMFSNESVPSELFANVLSAQTTQVDTVAGATVTSRAYLKAIENALTEKEN